MWNKYNATRTTYKGYTYDSGKEARYAMFLDGLLEAKKIKKYKVHPRFDLRVKGIHVCYYTPDFQVWHKNKVQEIIDVKGVMTDTFRLKWALMKALYGKKYLFTIEKNI